ncbi:MAG TPA: hypothetical protein VFZ89_02055 [Solirubrobacteraceae bacterium]
MSALTVLTPREASMFACLCDTVVAPAGELPGVAQTDAAFAFDQMLAASPPLNRLGLRALIVALELAPLTLGARRRLRRLDAQQRTDALARLARTNAGAGMLEIARGIAYFSYYGDDTVMRRLGYDADAVVARAREVRACR